MDAIPPHDPAGFEEALSEATWVRLLALAVVRDATQADDLAQEAWLAFLRKRPRPGAGLRSWFRRTILNSVRMHRRGEARRAAREARAARSESAEGDDPQAALARLESQEALLRAVRELPELY